MFLSFLCSLFGVSPLHAQSYNKLWQRVEDARKKSLPKTVIDLTQEIYRKAEQEQNAGQMLKAAVCRDAYQEYLTPDSLYAHLDSLEQWALREQNPVTQAILYSLLGQQYVEYVQYNRRQLTKRTELDEATPSDDIREWSSGQFFDKIDTCLQASIRPREALLAMSSDQYIPLVIQEEGSRAYGHDLYHLLGRRAVELYGAVRDFARTDSLQRVRVDEVYQNMLAAYAGWPGYEDACLLSELEYWQWKMENGVEVALAADPERETKRLQKEYLQLLDSLIAEYGSRAVCVEAYIQKAELLHDRMQRHAEALRVCKEGIRRYASNKRVNLLKNMEARLLQPCLRVSTSARVYPGDSVQLQVGYRNLDAFVVNVYRTDFREFPLEGVDWDDKAFWEKHTERLSSLRFDLGEQTDETLYQWADTALQVKAPDVPGVYVLQLDADGEKVKPDACLLFVSRFRVLYLPLPGNRLEATVVDALSGHPVQGATVSFYTGYDSKTRKLHTEAVTDAQGTVTIDWNSKIRMYKVRLGEDTAMPLQHIFYNGNARTADGEGEEEEEHIDLLTDRSLYRPGQTVYVKGIVYVQKGATANVLEGQNYTVRLLDANRKELSSQEVVTNDFGSFTAAFTLPAACLNGSFTIDVDDEATANIRVEEYKRPSFAVSFNPLKEAYSLGDTVMLTGKVESFSGVPVQELPLSYRITRSHDRWWRSAAGWEALVADTVSLDASGGFSIPVVLQADGEGGDRPFSFLVSAEVTDAAGETQSADYLLRASQKRYDFRILLDNEERQSLCKEDTLSARLSVLNANSQPLDVQGAYRLYVLENPDAEGVKGLPLADEGTFVSGGHTFFPRWKELPSGRYRLMVFVPGCEDETNVETVDVCLFSRSDTRPAVFTDVFLYIQEQEFAPGKPAVFYFGTSHRDACVWVDVFGKAGRLESHVMELSDSIVCLRYPYQEAYGEGIVVSFTFVKNNQVHSTHVSIERTQPDRILDMKWEVFRDRLRPGQQEEWKLVVKTPQGLPAAAELLATMYDASLDRLYPNNQSINYWYRYYLPYVQTYRGSDGTSLRALIPTFPLRSWNFPMYDFDRFYQPSLPVDVAVAVGYGRILSSRLPTGAVNGRAVAESAAADVVMKSAALASPQAMSTDTTGEMALAEEVVVTSGGEGQRPDVVRTNFAETAFFYPQLRTNEQGEVVFSFTMPESQTTWNFRAWSHTKDMMTGRLDASVVTAKEFMLTPNMPRFVRVGDKTQIAASVANLTQETVKGKAVLTLFDPVTEKAVLTRKQSFTAEAGKTAAVSFSFEVPDRYDLLGVRIVADGGSFSDGEQHLLPVLSNKEFITETVAMPIRGKETRTFSLDSLFNGHHSSATDRRLTVEFTGNPAWYAVLALPSLGQQEADNAVAWATAWYANALAGYIAGSQPRIKAVIDAWKAAGASRETFLSQLEKNQELKDILLSESPWLLEATTETEQMKRLSVLFDVNQQNIRLATALARLKDLQGADGAWSWYKGMRGSHYITDYVATLLVRLPLMTGTKLDDEAAGLKQHALDYLGVEAVEEYRRCLRMERDGTPVTTLSDAALNWLYLLALDGAELQGDALKARNYFFDRLGSELAASSMARKAKAAVVLLKNGRAQEAAGFVASLEEHLVQEDELGAHFAFYDTPYRWGMQPIPVHVAVMEALHMAGGHDALLEEMKLWLLKQKQATSWDSPVSTADAVYALLCQGSDLLANQGDVVIRLGSETLGTRQAEAAATSGLAYVKQAYTEGSPLRARQVEVEKRDEGVAWGAVYAQYLSPIADVKQHGGPLSVEKKLYVERLSADGQKTLQPVAEAGSVAVGDKVVSRITIRLDRAMDFVQLKDSRAACLEPMSTLSGYRWGAGTGYYVEVEDAGTNFFFDALAKGTYVLEASYRVARAGAYETGLATLQCAYAPEYNSHSAGGTLVVE